MPYHSNNHGLTEHPVVVSPYVVQFFSRREQPPIAPGSHILTEDGFIIITEDGLRFIVETDNFPLLLSEDGDFLITEGGSFITTET